MDNKVKEIKDHYLQHLRPDAYCKFLVENLKVYDELEIFLLKFLKDNIKSGIFKGTKLLEIGSGAIVHNVASASSQFTDIVQSDFVPENCEELRKWLGNESTLDWSPYLEIVAHLEEYSNLKAGVAELEKRIRASVKCVVHCDVFSDDIIPRDQLTEPETRPPYDLIITVYCLISSVAEFEDYVRALRLIHGLLRQGGGLIMCDLMNSGPYPVGGKSFHSIRLSRDDVMRGFGLAGFDIVECKEKINSKNVNAEFQDHFDDYDSLLCVAAKKP